MINSLVSIIVVNWNGRNLLQDCLGAILDQSYQNYEIIVVDNASQDDSVDFITKRYPRVKVISLKENTGFTGGNITGVNAASGEFIVLLNNDATLSKDWLHHMVTALREDNSLGSCSSKIIIDGTNKIDSVGDTFTTAFTGTKIGEYQQESLFEQKCLVPGACAAAVIYKKEMLDRIGFLDEDFYLNHEDTDLNMRAWLAGWKCLFVPEAVVYHKVSASIGVLSDTSVYFFSRNNEWVWVKNVPLKYIILKFPQRVIYELASFGYFCVLKNKWKPFLRGKFDALKGVRTMLKKRKQIQALIKLSDSEIRGGLVPVLDYLKTRLVTSSWNNLF